MGDRKLKQVKGARVAILSTIPMLSAFDCYPATSLYNSGLAHQAHTLARSLFGLLDKERTATFTMFSGVLIWAAYFLVLFGRRNRVC